MRNIRHIGGGIYAIASGYRSLGEIRHRVRLEYAL
jgi:hypothetical protein